MEKENKQVRVPPAAHPRAAAHRSPMAPPSPGVWFAGLASTHPACRDMGNVHAVDLRSQAPRSLVRALGEGGLSFTLAPEDPSMLCFTKYNTNTSTTSLAALARAARDTAHPASTRHHHNHTTQLWRAALEDPALPAFLELHQVVAADKGLGAGIVSKRWMDLKKTEFIQNPAHFTRLATLGADDLWRGRVRDGTQPDVVTYVHYNQGLTRSQLDARILHEFRNYIHTYAGPAPAGCTRSLWTRVEPYDHQRHTGELSGLAKFHSRPHVKFRPTVDQKDTLTCVASIACDHV
eukprot:COSAG01_NODE_14222_length_1481_cov_2.938495_1_plen_291_part_10